MKENKLKVAAIPGRNVDTALTLAWEEIQRSNPILSSPYFSPEFTKIVASVRDDVEVAVISQGGEPVAFFSFQRTRGEKGDTALQVGSVISDFAALICKPGFACDPLWLLKECGLVSFDFHNMLVSQKFFKPFYHGYDPSPQIDLSRGYEAYVEEKRAGGSDLLKTCANLARRMEREVGPLRFVAHSADPALLGQALALKSAQYLRTGAKDNFSIDWLRAIIEKIHATQKEDFAGMLSLLYAGDKLVATHFGMRSKNVWHYWFPAYDIEMAKYSPGLNLILKMAECAPTIGLTTIDLDKGRSLYKKRLMNKSVRIARGSVDRRYARRIEQQARRLVHWIRGI